ncbi:Uncharacterised protein [Mycobacteroides abscessus subsp. massiliense]|nr:Uncharacterised protein [Mycobacteroides abscessus subsp. massiliense]
MSVAEQYPARTDTNGTTWYRPRFIGKTPPSMWGWTGHPEQAHPDYAKVASICELPDNATPEDRAAILEFSAQLRQQAVAVATGNDVHRIASAVEVIELIDELAMAENPAATQQKGNSVTEMMVDGSPDVARYSEHSRYPLPPIPPQVEVSVDGYQRYKVPSPTTGKLTGFTRATTVARTTAEEYNLEQWKIRTKVMAVLKAKEAYEVVDVIAQGDEDTVELAQLYEKLLKAIAEGKSRPINQAIDKIDDVAGGADARELGGAVHDWLGELDSGRILLHQIPEQFQPYAVAYQECLMRAGLIAMPEYIERLVLNNRGIETICGRIDRIYRCVTDGQLYLGDLKTSESLDFSLLEYAIQFAAYGYAPLMCAMDRLSWEPMPKLVGLPHPSDNEVFGEDGDPRDPMCFCVHVPRTQPERSQVIPFNLRFGADAYIQALEVRKTRTAAKKEVLGQTTPIPSKEALRYVEARQALQNIHDEADARNVMEKYEDVLDDGLMEFGAQCFELL